MVRIEGELVIKRPVDEVFDFVADERNEPRYNPRMASVELVSTGPIGVGSRFRATNRSIGRTVEIVIEFTAYERPRWLASSTHLSAMEIRGGQSFEPVPEGIRMRWSWELEPHGLFKLLTPLIARIGRRQEETTWASLRQLLEAQATAPKT